LQFDDRRESLASERSLKKKKSMARSCGYFKEKKLEDIRCVRGEYFALLFSSFLE